MTAPIAPQQFAVADIVVRKRLRPVTPEGVAKMVAWLSDGGQKTPISVRVDGDAAHPILVAGAHRLAAAKELGWPTIVCVFEDMDEVDAQLWEIAENLHRNELTALERDEQVSLWIALSAKKRGQLDQVSKGGRGQKGGLSEVTQELGIDRSDARRALKVASLPEEAKTIARDAGLADNRTALLEAAERDTPEEAIAVLQLRAAVKETSLDKPAERRALEQLPEADRAELITKAQHGDKVSAKAKVKKNARKAREKTLGELQAPTGRFGCMVEDYEWDHVVWSRDTGMDRHAGNHYPVSDDAHTAEEIVKKTADRFAIADDNCVLFMWSTVQHLAIAMDVLRQRGFEYVSHYIWGKDKIGLGYWNRNKHEILLIGVKGHIDCPAPGDQWDSLLMSPRLEHSQKPDIFLEMIEGYFPTLPKMELNARRRRKGWKAWGFDAPEDEDDDSSRAAEAGQEETAPVANADLPASVARDEPGRIVEVKIAAGNTSAEIYTEGDVPEEVLEERIADLMIRTPPVPAEKIVRVDASTGEIIARRESETLNGGHAVEEAPSEAVLDSEGREFIAGGMFDPEIARQEAEFNALDDEQADTREALRGDEAAPEADAAADVDGAASITGNGVEDSAGLVAARQPTEARPLINDGGDHETVANKSKVSKGHLHAGAVEMPTTDRAVSENRAAPAQSSYLIEVDEDGDPIMPASLRRSAEGKPS